MEVTKVTTSQGTQPAPSVRVRPAQAASGAGAADPAANQGFLALLAAADETSQLGEPMLVAPAESLSAASPESDVKPLPVDATAIAAWQSLLPPATAGQIDVGATSKNGRLLVGSDGPQNALHSVSQTAGLQGAPQSPLLTTGAGLDAAQHGAAGVNPAVALGAFASVKAGADPGLLGLSRGLVAETSMLDTASDLREGAQAGRVTAYGRSFLRAGAASLHRAGNAASDEGSHKLGRAWESASAGGGASHAVGLSAILQSASASASERALSVTPSALAGDRGLADPHVRYGDSPLESTQEGAFAANPALGGNSSSSGGGRSGEGRSDGGSWLEAFTGSSPAELVSVDAANTFDGLVPPGGDERVTDQVAYWVNQKTQNAELTLDRDGQPVEISVALTGNEAHVTFRSDQHETRELLDKSMAELSELLRSEGLVLSGMSVGTSSARDPSTNQNGAQSRQRDGERRAGITVAAPVSATVAGHRPSMRDGSIDVFV